MIEWQEQPMEIVNLFNPAFISLIILSAIIGFESETDEDFPLIFSFIIVSCVLNSDIINSLPNSISTQMHQWINKNEYKKIFLKKSVIEYKPFIKEALIFGINQNIINLNQKGDLESNKELAYIKKHWGNMGNKLFLEKSYFLGRWFANSGKQHFILRLWGMKP